MEQEIKNAIGLGSPELVIESKPKPEINSNDLRLWQTFN